MAIARDPGNRAKVAVNAPSENIDAVGTCVGVKGSRVEAVVRELEGEKIDLLEWDAAPATFIANALQPATVASVNIDENTVSAEVIVPDDQLSLAIGRRGQNARLAAKLTGWKIDIKSESEAGTQFKEEIAAELFNPQPSESVDSPQIAASDGEVDLTELDGVGSKTATALRDFGFSTIQSIAAASVDELSAVPGVGTKTAEKILRSAIEVEQSTE